MYYGYGMLAGNFFFFKVCVTDPRRKMALRHWSVRAEVNLGGQLLVCPCPLTAQHEEIHRPKTFHVHQALCPLRLHFKYHKNLFIQAFTQLHIWHPQIQSPKQISSRLSFI